MVRRLALRDFRASHARIEQRPFNGPELAPAIFTPAELRKILAVCPAKLLPHIVIGAFSGIRAAEIERVG